jgi:membrane dipeptidase
MHRRRLLQSAGAAFGLGLALSPAGRAQGRRHHLADMHSHFGMHLPRPFGLDMRQHMERTGTTLLAWSIVDDTPWVVRGPAGLAQRKQPQDGELWAYFQSRVAALQSKLKEWKLTMALAPADVDAAAAGEPRVLLATEAANFLEGRLERVAAAHALGVRHMQLVHYIANPIGDFQTAEPKHGGLTAFGVQVVQECKRLGILVDLAHGTPALVDAAMAASELPMVWSHSWISHEGGAWNGAAYLARSLALPVAKKIAARGGVVGLWSVRMTAGDPQYRVRTPGTYADEIMRMCELIGPEHVAFGTDLEGVGPDRALTDYGDLRGVADSLLKRGLGDAALEGVLFGNYARVVKQAMAAARPA